MGGGGNGGGGGADKNRGIEKGRTKQAKVGVSKSVSVDVGEGNLKKTAAKAVPVPKAKPPEPKAPTAQPTGKVAFGTEVIDTAAAQAQLSAKQSEFGKTAIGKFPGVASLMGGASLAAQKKALEEGGTAVAVPGTSFAPQGQAYTEAPGMRSSAKLAGQRFKVGQTFHAKSGEDINVITMDGIKTQKAPSQYTTGPAGSIGKISATKPPKGSGLGYVGDVAGVTKTSNILGMDVTTFTGKTGYSPTGQKMDEPTGGGKEETVTTPIIEPEVTPEVTPEIVPDETVLAGKTRRTRFKRSGAGGTILEGFGALYS